MDYLEREQERRQADARRFADLDPEACQLCLAYGADKRSLYLSCFYAVHEAVPEAIDMTALPEEDRWRGYYLRICKSCRARLLGALEGWRNECVALRDVPKDHDGEPLERDESRDIPVRIYGGIVWMNDAEYAAFARSRGMEGHQPVRVKKQTQTGNQEETPNP